MTSAERGERFELVRPLGEGGMGIVYEARERTGGSIVALKMLRREVGSSIYRLKQEFRVLSDFAHPNVVRYFELFEDEGRLCLTMECVRGVDFLAYVRPEWQGPRHSHVASLTTPQSGLGLESGESLATTSHVDAGPLDVDRLRDGLRQVAGGLVALHAAGLVHRDVKPSNVLVTAEGRAVLLDFGLVVADDGGAVAPDEIVGTYGYMAPELLLGGPPTSAADWYAVGVVLYQALAGRMPTNTQGIASIWRRSMEPPPSPLTFDPTLPQDLSALSVALLDPDPARRPSGEEVARLLGVDNDAEKARASFRSQLRFARGVFVARENELRTLELAFERARRHRTTMVRIGGDPGSGKSALVRRFRRHLGEHESSPIVLTGRCYELESVPFAGVDGVIDALTRHLLEDDALARREHSAVDLASVARIFPVCWALVEKHGALPFEQAERDPYEARREGFDALVRIAARASRSAPLVVFIDDAQWLDPESVAVLTRLTTGIPRLLVVLAQRNPNEPDNPARELVASCDDVVEITLGPLSAEESERLAGLLLGESRSRIDPSLVVAQAGGYPLFIHEVALHTVSSLDSSPSNDLDTVLGIRVDRLPHDERRIFGLVAMAAAPIAHAVLREAAGIDGEAYALALSALRQENFVQFRTFGDGHVRATHDRVRALVNAGWSARERTAGHRRLADALARFAPTELDALAHHFARAGARAETARYSRLAGERAFAQLAFELAAHHYAIAIEHEDDSATRVGLEAALGYALASMGRGPEAARVYLRAAERATGLEALELRRSAGEQLLRCGHIEEGLAIVTEVLDALGVDVPSTPRRTTAALLTGLVRLRFRGLSLANDADKSRSREHDVRLESVWTAAASLSMVDTHTATYFQTRYLRLALDSGDATRALRGMVVLAASLTLVDGAPRRYAALLLDRARELAIAAPSPEGDARIALSDGIAALSLGDFPSCERSCELAETTLRERCSGVAWELVTARAFRLWAMSYQGRLAAIARLLPAMVEQARERGDRYALATLNLGPLCLVTLGDDDPDLARATCEAERGAWTAPSAHFQRLCALFALAQIDLYEGRATEAWERLSEAWGTPQHAMQMRVQFYRIDFLALRARAAIALAGEAGDHAHAIAHAEADARMLSKEKHGFADALAELLNAGIASHRGEDVAAILDRLGRARAACLDSGMLLHEALARLADARARGDSEAAHAASADLRSLGVRNEERMLALFLPGVGTTNGA